MSFFDDDNDDDDEWIIFVVWLTDEGCLALFPAATIAKDPHHLRISDTPQAEFEPAQNLSSDLVKWSCAVLITTTPSNQMKYQISYQISATEY